MLVGLPVTRQEAPGVLAVRVETPVKEPKAMILDVTEKGLLPQPILVLVDATPLAYDYREAGCYQVSKVLCPDIVEIARELFLIKIGHMVLCSTIARAVDLRVMS